MVDDVINQLLLSRDIPGVSFNFIAYVEPEMPRGVGQKPPPPLLPNSRHSRHILKAKILEGLRYTKNCHQALSLTHSLTLTHTIFSKMSKIILFINFNSIYSFFLDAWLFLPPLFQCGNELNNRGCKNAT